LSFRPKEAENVKLKPEEKLALAMFTNPGVYALLLGSGLSTAAGIPTGWSIVLDLIRRVAAAKDENCEPAPEKWYIEQFHHPPTFGALIGALELTAEESKGVLRPYIQRSEDDQDQENLKLPTMGHRSIARLVKMGYIRMILTINVDRLMETALQEEGIGFDALYSEAGFVGAPSPIHSNCTVAKIHGDYRGTEVRITAKELETYPKAIDNYLDRVLDDFGLIICGWSARWDKALRDAMLRCRNRRFSTYGMSLTGEDIPEEAHEVLAHCKADVVRIENADQAFESLLDRVLSLRETSSPHPLSTRMAVQNVKRYVEEGQRVKLETLVHEETEKTHNLLVSEVSASQGPTIKAFHTRIHKYEESMERLLAIIAALAYYGDGVTPRLLKQCISRIGAFPKTATRSGASFSSHQRYPALLLTYTAGIVSLAADRYTNLFSVLVEPRWWDEGDQRQVQGIEKLTNLSVFGENGKSVPLSENVREILRPSFYVRKVLRKTLEGYLPDQRAYEVFFDIFEYMHSLTYIDLVGTGRAPVGLFADFREDFFRPGDLPQKPRSPVGQFVRKGISQGSDWDVLKVGFFGSSPNRFARTMSAHRGWIASIVRE
jgi:hypothetical protein